MTDKKPEDWLNRSPKFGERSNKYSTRIDNALEQSSRANRAGTNLSWEQTTNQFDELMRQPRSILITFVVLALGFFMMVLAFAGGGGRMFALGLFVAAVAGYPSYYIVSSMRRSRDINDRLLFHNLEIDRQQEDAVNLIRTQFTPAELQHAALEANVSTAEIQGALISAAAVAFAHNEERREAGAHTADIRRNQQELDILDKQMLLEEAKGRVRVDEFNAQAEASREEIKVRHDLDVRKVKEDLYAEQERFDLEMKRLDKTHTQAAAMQRINEVTQLRKTLLASHAELRNNPALQDQLMAVIDEVNILEKALRKMEPMSTEDYQQQELIDKLLTRILLKRHNFDDDAQTVA